MNAPTVHALRSVAPDVDMLSTALPVPIGGFLPVNAFLLRSQQPVLVDAGVSALAHPTLDALRELTDPAKLRWIYLTHMDADHIGCVEQLLEEAPEAQIVTTFLGMAKLGLRLAVPPSRVLLLNPGQTLDVGDRKLRVGSPPCYDAPETTTLFDESRRTLFASDCFGSVVASPRIAKANDIASDDLLQGSVGWLTIDSPWIHSVRRDDLKRALDRVTELSPEVTLSAHLPPAYDMIEQLAQNVLQAPDAPPFVGPDQDAFERLLAAQ